MREIKFRAWDGERMHFDHVVMYLGRAFIEHPSLSANIKIDPSYDPYEITPMQFTGLVDKNGVEIYEGDIISEDDEYPCWVEWDISGSWIHRLSARFACPIVDSSEGEVIGNIYENPELLEIEDD